MKNMFKKYKHKPGDVILIKSRIFDDEISAPRLFKVAVYKRRPMGYVVIDADEHFYYVPFRAVVTSVEE